MAAGQLAFAQNASRTIIASIVPSLNTGQDYSPWLNDDLSKLVQNQWATVNAQYVDVTLTLSARTSVSRIALYDHAGSFASSPAYIYALNGSQRTLLGTFTGAAYLQWVNIAVSPAVTADAIIVRKYGNNLPQKVQIFGTLPASPVLAQSVISFSALAPKTVGDTPSALVATSTNGATPITFASSNPALVSVSNASGRWQATALAAGTVTITASQAGSTAYLPAANVAQPLTVLAASTPTPTLTTAGKISLDPRRWYQLTNSPDGIAQLFDGVTSANISTGWGKIIPTFDAYYALKTGEAITIESVKFFDGSGSFTTVPMTLSVITDTWQRVPVATFTGEQFAQWVGPYPSRPTTFRLDNVVRNARYLVITSAGGYPTEMELYGTLTAPTPTPLPTPGALAAQKQTKLRQSLGVNAFEWDLEDPTRPSVVDTARLRAMKNFAGIRHYLDWEKIEWTQGGYTFNPSHRGGWNYDAMYERLKQEGVEVLVCLKDMPPWLQATYPLDQRAGDNVPVRYGQPFLNPASYVQYAKAAFQVAARYGANPGVDRTLLSVDATSLWQGDVINQVKVGLGMITYIECDNERDKWWAGRKAYQTAREYAAQLSAFYDGHKNTLGPGVGVKNADPTMQVVMAGLANANFDYVRGMIEWCREFRGYRPDGSVNLCWDVINYHLYSNDAGTSQGGSSTRGAAPEASEAGRVAQAFVQLAHEYAGGMPVWVTETGYDLNQGSPLKAVAVGTRSVLETQADWTLRTALAYARWGVERVFHYQLYDDNPASPTQFGSMGLLNTDKTPRPAAQYLSQANRLMGSHVYKETLNADPIVDRYELNEQSVYMLVVPDEKGRTAPYTLNLGSATQADVYRPTTGSRTMQVQRVALQSGQLALQVTETPVFVVAVPTTTLTLTPPPAACSATGTLLREQWSNVSGTGVASIPVATPPTSSTSLTQLETSSADLNYGARLRGYLCPPLSGAYTFSIVGDDACELWLSTDDQPATRTRIASCTGWTSGPHDFTRYASQQSTPVNLVAGRRYYLEALHKQGWGTGYLAVAWRLPDGTFEAPIAGSRLSPFIPTTAFRTAATVTAATPGANLAAATAVTLTAAPNPLTAQSTVRFKLDIAGPVTLTLYDMQGRLVRQIFSGTVAAGMEQETALKVADLPSGVYSIRLLTATRLVHHRVVVAR